MSDPYDTDDLSDPYDTDDRVRCRCRHYPMSAFEADPKRKDGKVRCLNVTRHPSGRCGDCRRARQQACTRTRSHARVAPWHREG